ncbi:TSUP family transporter [Candidatus Peregrinibacteria bacterium]|nr:TSUP family transporter [Candidatus Peregrinibacteria bacterium]
MEIKFFLLVLVFAFALQYMDATIGMGYGNITPLLILIGFDPINVIIAVLGASVVLSITTGVLHHYYKNVDFSFDSPEFRITGILIIAGIIGVLLGVIIAVNISEKFLKSYIAILVIVIGALIIFKRQKKSKFSWKKLVGLGSLASFNQGISGGGFGPVLAGGQILSGVDARKAVGITALTEGIISFFAISFYIALNGIGSINWLLILALIIGGLSSTPCAIYTVKKFHPKKLKFYIGLGSVILGVVLLLEVIF